MYIVMCVSVRMCVGECVRACLQKHALRASCTNNCVRGAAAARAQAKCCLHGAVEKCEYGAHVYPQLEERNKCMRMRIVYATQHTHMRWKISAQIQRRETS